MHRTLSMSRIGCRILLTTALAGALATGGIVAGQETVPAPRREAGPAAAVTRGNQIIVPIGSSQRLQMKGRKAIQSVVNPKEGIAFVAPVQDDPTTVMITGREAGLTRITLTAADGSEENYEVVVQIDIEFLRSVLLRAVPTASLQLIPAATGTIVIAGTVAHAEDIDVIMRTAQGVVSSADHVVNAMHVGGVQQVQLDCCVALVSRTQLRQMSFDFLTAGRNFNFSSTVGGALQNPAIGSSLASLPGTFLPVTNVVTAPNGQPANFFLGVFNDKALFWGLLQALKTENLAKILAEPKVVTLSGRSANLLSGGQQAIPETAGLGSVSVRFEPFGTQLSVLPIVLGNGRIHLEVEPEVSNIDPAVGTSINGTVVPGRTTQRVHTTVEMEDGQTLAIGGLIENDVTASEVKVPVLGDLPIIGAAFSRKEFSESERELVVLITPHLVDAMSCDQVPHVLPGQETRSPDDFELFLEGILEAPRGPRQIDLFHGQYVPAYKNGPTANQFPCGGNNCGNGNCGNGCGNGNYGGNWANGNGGYPAANGAMADPRGDMLSRPAMVPSAGAANRPADGNGGPNVLEGARLPAADNREGAPFALPSAAGNGEGDR
jgi:pilus assembly protein CpaC